MRDIFIKSGFICCRECAFYDIQSEVHSQKKCPPLLRILEKIALKDISHTHTQRYVSLRYALRSHPRYINEEE